MTARIVLSVLIAALIPHAITTAQTPTAAVSQRYLDPAGGLSLEQAIARALEREPALRAARREIDVARAARLQASLRSNPTMSFEHRREPAGTDAQTSVEVEWPLDLFRRRQRIAVADREVAAVQLAVSDRERLLAADVRMRYGDAAAAIRDLSIVEELAATTQRQLGLLRARVDEGATPPLERDLVDVELRRLEADRLLQAGRTEAAVIELKRVLGMRADAVLMLRDTLEGLARDEGPAAAPAGAAQPGVGQRADVRAAEAQLNVADAKIARARAGGKIDVGLFANYMRMDAGFPQRGFASDGALERIRSRFHYVSAGVMVALPLLNRNQGDVAAASAERAAAADVLDAVRLSAESELAAARARHDRAQQAVRAFSAGAQALARQNLSVVSQSYDLGRVTVFDVLAENRRYLDVERAYTEALKAAYEARTALHRALGGVQ